MNRTLVSLLLLFNLTVQAQIIPEGKTWKGIFELSTKGSQPAQANFNFDKEIGSFNLPDLIPIPLHLINVARNGDSLFFTIRFRSGNALCYGQFSNDTIRGVMKKESLGDSPFWLTYNYEDKPKENKKPSPNDPYEIRAFSNTSSELFVKRKLEEIVRTYDLEKFTYTKEIVIQDSVIPHSHPVLTISTADTGTNEILSTFLHEQMHWYGVFHDSAAQQAIDDFKTMYPDAPVDLPEGGGSEFGTYLHILINYLEYHCLKEVLDQRQAEQIIEYWSGHHYKWIYATVLRDQKAIQKVLDKYDLLENL